MWVGESRTEEGSRREGGGEKTAGAQLFLWENRKAFVVNKAVVSYFCAFFKVHLVKLLKWHLVFLAVSINIPYGEASFGSLQYCVDYILMDFHYWSCSGLYVLFFQHKTGSDLHFLKNSLGTPRPVSYLWQRTASQSSEGGARNTIEANCRITCNN